MKGKYRMKLNDGTFSRRAFLRTAGAGALGMMTGAFRPLLYSSPAAHAQNRETKTGFDPDLDVALSAIPGEVTIFPGKPTRVWRFKGKVLKGNTNKLVEFPGSYLGPMIKADTGDKVRIRFANRIPDETIIHWHGLHVPAIMDGHPRHVIPEGEFYHYEFEVKNRAGTYWYHPHPHGRTGPQVYGGLAGLFLVSDAEEKAAGLPEGAYDIPLVIQDRSFDNDNQLVYTSGHMMEQMNGFLGDWILVNGMPKFTLPVSTRAYRLRLLNGSNARIYKLAWRDGRPLVVIGTDGGLLKKPVFRDYLFLSPGERVELWADFGNDPVGFETALVSLPFEAGMTGRGMMMGGRMGNSQRRPNGAGFSIFNVKVAKHVGRGKALPERLSELTPVRQNDAGNFDRPKQFYLSMRHMQWTINGRIFQMEDVADDEIVRLGSKEIWEFNNIGGGMMRMMNMPHPIHLHGKQFRVVERRGVMHEGYVDDGWKDTVLLMPGERIRIMTAFDDFPGLFLYHCHNLEHEDMGMMRNYFVKA